MLPAAGPDLVVPLSKVFDGIFDSNQEPRALGRSKK